MSTLKSILRLRLTLSILYVRPCHKIVNFTLKSVHYLTKILKISGEKCLPTSTFYCAYHHTYEGLAHKFVGGEADFI